MIIDYEFMNNYGLPAEELEHKLYLVPEEDSFVPPQDGSAEIKYGATFW